MNDTSTTKSIRLSVKTVLLFVIMAYSLMVSGQTDQTLERVGWWKFDDVNNPLLPEPGYGLPLELVGTHQLVAGHSETDFAAKIGVGSHYRMTHGISANGGGSFVNEFTLQIDFMVESLDIWHCFFQTYPENTNDGDCFINPSGNIGVAATGYSGVAVKINEWYRLVITVDNGSFYRYYLDGELITQGAVQDIDGRFSLDPVLLMFADEDGEDNLINVSEIGIWDIPLNEQEVTELGGFSHPVPQHPQLIGYPFLQSMTKNSVYVCWHDTLQNITSVEYGITPSLGFGAEGYSEMITSPYRWHSVQLTGLTPGTRYFYRIVTGSLTSAVFSFKTLPDDDFNNHVRFLLFSDSQEDSAATGRIIRSAKAKVQELYGPDITESINLIMHAGDIVSDGSNISQWTDQFFRPFAPLSANIPFMSVAGNHELEHFNYYEYVKYDEFSAFPSTHPLFEKVWTYTLPRILMIGLNSNLIYQYGDVQKQWLDETLALAENDKSIDFVFCFLHHPPVSELWGEGITAWVSEDVLGVLKKYSKVQQLSYGHTHAYEMGVVESGAENADGDFRISCVGGGGGYRDRWGEYTNNDYPEINMALDHYFYVLFDINLAEKSYTGQMFDLGNIDVPVNNQVSDTWHRILDQVKPDQPTVTAPTYSGNGQLVLHASPFSGIDELMTSQFQITGTAGNYSTTVFSKSTDWRNVYGVDAEFTPVDLNAGVDLTSLMIPPGILTTGNTYYFRARYRDQNLKWSEWSDELSFVANNAQGIDNDLRGGIFNFHVSPNPFKTSLSIDCELDVPEKVTVELLSVQGKTLQSLIKNPISCGHQTFTLNTTNLNEGIYYVRVSATDGTETQKVVLIK